MRLVNVLKVFLIILCIMFVTSWFSASFFQEMRGSVVLKLFLILEKSEARVLINVTKPGKMGPNSPLAI